MSPHIADLREALAESLLTASYDPQSPYPETLDIDYLTSLVMEYDAGLADYEELDEAFGSVDTPGFDFPTWYQEQRDEGIYD